MTLLLRDVEVEGRRVDVTIDAGTVRGVDPVDREPHGGHRMPDPDGRTVDEVVDGDGGALLPGLWDHHVHLLAEAAARASLLVGPADVTHADGLDAALRRADAELSPGTWLRAVGYHESVAGELDRYRLDTVVADRPVRVQHRSGAAWILNSVAADVVGLDAETGSWVERDRAGRTTGRVFGAEDWLRARAPTEAPDLAVVGREASRLGIVGFTDATPSIDTGGWELLAAARSSGALHQHVVVTGAPELADRTASDGLTTGPVKIYLADHALPGLDDVVAAIGAARDAGRPVAFHAVTRTAVVLAITALRSASPGTGDRIEHGSVVPPDVDAELAELGVTVVTQPSFVAERGDTYLDEVDADDRPHLYRCASLPVAGIAVAGSSDAPHATLDPWAAMRAATDRRVPDGRVLGPDERLTAAAALGLYLGAHDAPGGPRRTVRAGERADLCLLDRPLADALRSPSAEHVTATIVAGVVRYLRR